MNYNFTIPITRNYFSICKVQCDNSNPAPSPHELRLTLLDANTVCLGDKLVFHFKGNLILNIIFGNIYNYPSMDLNDFNNNFLSPRVVDLLFIVTSAASKIKALFCRINFDYATNFVKNVLFLLSFFFSFEHKKREKKYTLNLIVLQNLL